MVTIHLTENQAEALFCILRHPGNDHFLFNNNNGLTFLRDYERRMEEAGEEYEELDCEEMNKARLCAAWQIFPQLSDAAQEAHGTDELPPDENGTRHHMPAINNGESWEDLQY
jgi:hypothetical protein